MQYDCLIVDDEKELGDATCEYFEMFGLKAKYVATSSECLSILEANEVKVLLLDINLEQESGFTLCKKIREAYDLPILFISARQSDDDVLIALNIGGDDYIKKPYSLSILLAKVKVILKRLEQSGQSKAIASTGLTIDADAMKVYVDGKEVTLKTKEFRVLYYLYEHKNKVVTKDELFLHIWGDEFFSDGTLNVHIRKIREKIEKNPNEPKYIKTIWGTGYRLEL
ncbi:DNA-binding response regulator [Lachnospiraceae bacterium KM106-2]|nr:DNA-binding response regulator [Lachnospiraceae bacterium KM106-2]